MKIARIEFEVKIRERSRLKVGAAPTSWLASHSMGGSERRRAVGDMKLDLLFEGERKKERKVPVFPVPPLQMRSIRTSVQPVGA
ncbi:hypothetical protein IFM47457_10689 [Aspergillus lentulus]|nr:hypothetical protein IFM47457_10689 [Aspergillus lentulus]